MLVSIATSKINIKAVNQIQPTYVDDTSLAESVNLKKMLVPVPDREQATSNNCHAKTGHVLPEESSAVYRHFMKTKEHAERNQIKINYKKNKSMLFNPCTSLYFMPEFQLGAMSLSGLRK